MADMQSFTEPYLEKNFHGQTKMALENKQEWRQEGEATIVLERFPFLTLPCSQPYVHRAPGNTLPLLFLISCPLPRRRCEPGISRRTEEIKVLQTVPTQDVNTPGIHTALFPGALNTCSKYRLNSKRGFFKV